MNNKSTKNEDRREFKRLVPGADYKARLDYSKYRKIKDISLGGIRIESSKRLTPSNVHELGMSFSGKNSFSLPAIVVWSSKTSNNPATYEAGMKFIGLNAREISAVRSVILSSSSE